MHNTSWSESVRRYTLALIESPSIVGTPGEAATARLIHSWLAAWPYFRAHPGHLWLQPTAEYRQERYSVMALVRGGQAPDAAPTVLMVGHLDTVGTEDYGPLQPWACRPAELTPRLLAELQAVEPDHPAVADLASGHWLAGRGALDMKSGVASHLAVLEAFAAAADAQTGAVLLMLTPDEEDSSQGILSALRALPGVAAAHGLRYAAAVNSDLVAPRYPGDPARYIYLGSTGKLLPAVYIVGRETHVGQPFEGLDPNLVAAELTRRICYRTDLADAAGGVVTPPPVSLKQEDLKETYTVQTALAAWCYYNVMLTRRTPRDMLDLFRAEAEAAMADATGLVRREAQKWARRAGMPVAPAERPGRVLTYSELHAAAVARAGAAEVQRSLQEAVQAMSDSPGALELRRFSRRVVEAVWPLAGIRPPAAVLFLASTYFPPVQVTDPLLLTVTRQEADRMAAEAGVPIEVRHFYPYISDMSFLGGRDTPADLDALAANMPAWGSAYRVDHAFYAGLGIPVANIGPYGLDPHKRTERVETDFSFQTVPELTWRILQRLLAGA